MDETSAISVRDGHVTVIDGMEFREFDTENEMAEFARVEDAKQVKTVKRQRGGGKLSVLGRHTPTLNKAGRVATGAQSDAMSHTPSAAAGAPTATTGIPPPPPLTMMQPSPEVSAAQQVMIINPVKSSAKSAFMSGDLDAYLSQTKRDIETGRMCSHEHFGAPPEDSPIYSYGILKQNDVEPNSGKRKPFSDLPLLARGPSSGAAASSSASSAAAAASSAANAAAGSAPVAKRPRERWPSPAIVDEKGMPIAKIKKPKLSQMTAIPAQTQIDSVPENFYNTEQLEARFMQLMHETVDANKRNRKTYSVGFHMDNTYVHYALDALKLPEFAQQSPATSPKKSLSPVKDTMDSGAGGDGPSPKSKRAPVKEPDLMHIHSRHSKRDIRLPARYHQSGLMLGNQWVMPSMDETPKKGRRRLVDEQKRLEVKLRGIVDQPNKAVLVKIAGFDNSILGPVPRSVSHPPPASKQQQQQHDTPTVEREKKIFGASSKRRRAIGCPAPQLAQAHLAKTSSHELDDDTSRLAANDFVEVSKKLHAQRMSQLTSQRSAPSTPVIVEHRKGINRQIRTMPKSNNIKANRLVPNGNFVNGSILAGPIDLKLKKMKEMKELYRNLYYQNKSGRREHYARRRRQPRVIKKKVVEEGIKTIAELQCKEEHLKKAKHCMKLWNQKLKQCFQVAQAQADREKDPEQYDQGMRVVHDIMHVYQKSFTGVVSKRLDQLQALKAAAEPGMPQLLQEQPPPLQALQPRKEPRTPQQLVAAQQQQQNRKVQIIQPAKAQQQQQPAQQAKALVMTAPPGAKISVPLLLRFLDNQKDTTIVSQTPTSLILTTAQATAVSNTIAGHSVQPQSLLLKPATATVALPNTAATPLITFAQKAVNSSAANIIQRVTQAQRVQVSPAPPITGPTSLLKNSRLLTVVPTATAEAKSSQPCARLVFR